MPTLYLRSRIVLLFALSSLALAALVAVPLLLTLRLSEASTAEERHARQTSDWQRSLDTAGEQLLTQASNLISDPALLAAATADDRERVRKLLETTHAPPGTRVDLLGPAGQLLGSTAGLAADAPMVDVSRFLGEQAGEAHTVSVEASGAGGLLLVVTRRIQAGGAVSVGGGIDAALRVFAELERSDAFIADRNRKLLAATRPDLWPQVLASRGAAKSEPSQAVSSLTLHDRVVSLISGVILDAALDQVGWLFSISDDSLRTDRKTLLFVLSGGLSATVFVVLCLFFYGYIKESLDPLTDVARTMHAVASGDIMASVEVASRRDEVGDIVSAMEVFRRNAMELERLRLRAALQTTQQHSLIRSEMARLAATLEPASRDAMLADLREIETRQLAVRADRDQPETSLPGGDADAADRRTAGSALATAFRQMAGRVMEQHRKLDSLLAERTRDLEIVRQALAEREHLSYLRKELEVARELQLSSLPKTFPAFPDRHEFDLFATMVPAKEVGGDFYDFSLLPDHRLALFIGDAAGKGVSAAMFIAMARSLLRSAVVRGATPGEALELANATLSVENPSMMFATAFVALLDPLTGVVDYAAAGHNPPYLRSAAGRVTALPLVPAVALGIEESWTYQTSRLTLAADDCLLLFTDGVTEAVGPGGSFFLERRLVQVLEQARSGSPLDLVAEVQDAVAAFSGDEAQADDITLLCLRWAGQPTSPPAARQVARAGSGKG